MNFSVIPKSATAVALVAALVTSSTHAAADPADANVGLQKAVAWALDRDGRELNKVYGVQWRLKSTQVEKLSNGVRVTGRIDHAIAYWPDPEYRYTATLIDGEVSFESLSHTSSWETIFGFALDAWDLAVDIYNFFNGDDDDGDDDMSSQSRDDFIDLSERVRDAADVIESIASDGHSDKVKKMAAHITLRAWQRTVMPEMTAERRLLGSVLHREFLAASEGADTCQVECLAENACKAFTYLKRTSNRAGECVLFSNLTSTTSSGPAVSGKIEVRRNVRVPARRPSTGIPTKYVPIPVPTPPRPLPRAPGTPGTHRH